MRGPIRLFVASTQPIGQPRERVGDFLRDHFLSAIRPQLFRFGERLSQELNVASVLEAIEIEFVFLRRVAGKVRVNLEAIEIAHDQERRIVERLAIAKELLVRGVEVLVLPLVFPAELLIEPDIGPTLAIVGRVDAFLKREPFARRINIGGLGMIEQFAQIEEVLLIGAAFRKVGGLPFGDELVRGHGDVAIKSFGMGV